MKGIVRLAGRDLKGSRRVQAALTSLKGVGASMAKAVVRATGLEGTEKIGSLPDETIKELDDVIHNPASHDIPPWMLNRRKDIETGEDRHLLGGDIEIAERADIGREKHVRSRRGIRHERGLPVRGQRTRSTGRKGMTVGVERKKLKMQKEKEE
ncbi:30S ribosomal protein S13 [candidate division MSBL1 archaeon SCGC-AAA261O19]|uniref:Small ribosomal subunit protein uS13 n=2 Tax=candidate division MSBL1 TaxID=215777 RepID=A0A133VRF3_9EURY|nr:30S ribosomal protein S13 [candidate division MSBL1 archaeon SCGC-AAA261O19]KXB09024.1 30S ribosomal protein S13 [candidate division MSBL1 archaeon SCGC-AAA833K04]